jgi:rhomboid family GlyGly-CTERM serine protease
LIAICVAVAALDAFLWPAADLQLRYQRHDVLAGEFWRLASAHFVHADLGHLLLNMLGTAVIAALFPQTYTVSQWIVILLVSMLAIDGGFLLHERELEWYVGSSGMLHGALAAGALAWWRLEPKTMAAALTVIVLGKLGWEQWQGALPLAGGLNVIVDAHLYGAIGGALAAAVWPAASRAEV